MLCSILKCLTNPKSCFSCLVFFAHIPSLLFKMLIFIFRHWERQEQLPPTLKMKPLQKADQEQQDPLEYLQSDEDEEDEKTGPHSAARRRLQEQRERMHGALALIELANIASAQLRQ